MANSYTTRLKKRLPAVGDVNWDDEWHDNEKIDEVVAGALLSVNRVISGGVVTAGTGLVVNYTAAVVWMAGARLSIVSGSLTMTAAPVGQQLVNWVYVNGAGTVVVSATPPSGDYIPLAQVDTSDTAIVRIADLRPMSALDKDASGGVAGLTGLAINFMNALGTIKSFFTNANTAARTYTFQDRDGTIADDTDLALKAPLASPALTGTPTAPTQDNTDSSTKIATTKHISNVFAGSVAASGYQKFKNGIVIQWGRDYTAATTETEKTHSYPLAFANIFSLVAISEAAVAGIDFRAYGTGGSSFTTKCSATNLWFRYIAIGYIAPA
jgi:hypothetical protein